MAPLWVLLLYYLMVFKLRNLLFGSCANRLTNYHVASGLSRDSRFTTTLTYGLTYDYYALYAQACVFRDQLMSNSNIDFRAVFGVRDRDKAVEKAFNLYIYSYAKALLYALNDKSVTSLPQDSPIFLGHGIFHRILTRGEFYVSDNSYSMLLSVEVSDAERKALSDYLLYDFKFLKEFVRSSGASGIFNFRSRDYDYALQKLNDHANITFVDNNLREVNSDATLGVSKTVTEDSTSPNLQLESSQDMVDHYPRRDASNMIAVHPFTRVIEIYSLDSDVLDEFLSRDQLCLGNSCLCLNDLNSWYYIQNDSETVFNSLSYHLCRANFLYLKDIDENKVSEGNYYYSKLPRVHEDDILINQDVRANTYLYPRSYFNPDELMTFRNDPNRRPVLFSSEFYTWLAKQQASSAPGTSTP